MHYVLKEEETGKGHKKGNKYHKHKREEHDSKKDKTKEIYYNCGNLGHYAHE